MNRIYQHDPDVLWHPVGADPDEILLVHEGAEIRMHVLSGRTGIAVWTRLDGTRTVGELAAEMAAAGGLPGAEAERILSALLDDLRRHGLIAETSHRRTPDSDEAPSPWPDSIEPPALSPFDPEALAPSELVALGSFQGGFNNAGGQSPCSGGQGGVDDVGGFWACRPGTGYGFINAGWFGTPCPP